MARKKTETATESSKEIKAKGKFTRAKKSMKTTTKNIHQSGNSLLNLLNNFHFDQRRLPQD